MASSIGGQVKVVGSSPAPERFPRWAPDGSLLAFFRGDSLMVGAPKNDANPRWLKGAHCGLGSGNVVGMFAGLAWSADGQTLGCLGAENGHLGVVVADARDGNRRFVSLPDSLKAPLGLVFSPDGRELILSALVKAHDWWALWRTDIATGGARRIPQLASRGLWVLRHDCPGRPPGCLHATADRVRHLRSNSHRDVEPVGRLRHQTAWNPTSSLRTRRCRRPCARNPLAACAIP